MFATTVRIDKETKEKATILAEEIGFSFSDLINVLLKKAIRDGGIDLSNVEPKAKKAPAKKATKAKATNKKPAKKPAKKSLFRKKLIA